MSLTPSGYRPRLIDDRITQLLSTVGAVSVDMTRVDAVRRDPARVLSLLGSLARNSATTVSRETLRRDAGLGGDSLSDTTMRDYLSALSRWSPSDR